MKDRKALNQVAQERHGNIILDNMPEAARAAFAETLERVQVGVKDAVQEPGKPVKHVYFPISAIFSTVARTKDGTLVEVATIGNEGMAGLSVFLGRKSEPLAVFAQVPGESWRTTTASFQTALNNGSWLHRTLHRYTQSLMVQISQGVICNVRHEVHQRCARWLLMTHDRVGADTFLLTQEFLAQMLAVRRASVNEAAGDLQRRGLIEYSRGKITIRNRRGLEKASCECYRFIADEYKSFEADARGMSQ